MSRMIKKLSGLEIDEVSLVDRPANQHGLVAIAKRNEESTMTDLYLGDGTAIDEDELQHGDVVYDEAGTEFVYVEGSDEEQGGDDTYDGTEYANEEVGKARYGTSHSLSDLNRARSRFGAGQVKTAMGNRGKANDKLAGQMARGRQASAAQTRVTSGARNLVGSARSHATDVRSDMGRRTLGAQMEFGRRNSQTRRVAGELKDERRYENPRGRQLRRGYAGAGAAAGVAVGGGAGYAGGRFGKSYGDEILEELSKAYTGSGRDEVIAKFADNLEEISKRNDQLEDMVTAMLEQNDQRDYVELAKSYDIPGSAEGIGGLLFRAAQVLPEEDVEALDQLFSSIGYVGKSDSSSSFFDQLGFDGRVEDDVMAQVYAAAGDIVTKGDGSLSPEAATTALFSANPAAYDQYEAEQRFGR